MIICAPCLNIDPSCIEGEFGQTSFEAVAKTTESAPSTSGLTACWNVISILSTENLSRSMTKGCLQGGVLSPLLWTLVVDRLLKGLEGLNKGYYYAVRYADGIAIVIKVKFLGMVSYIAKVILVFEDDCDLGCCTV